LRQFRLTLLCRGDVKLERPATPERMERFLFSSPARQSDGQLEGLNSVSITTAPEEVARVAALMRKAYPLPVSFTELLESVPDREGLCDILFALICSGFAQFHVHDFAAEGKVGARPRASRLARWEAARTRVVTYSNHTALKLDSAVRSLIELMDGTRGFDDIVAELARAEGAPPREDIRARLPEILAHMARTGLLEG
jgi:hypothetical protein